MRLFKLAIALMLCWPADPLLASVLSPAWTFPEAIRQDVSFTNQALASASTQVGPRLSAAKVTVSRATPSKIEEIINEGAELEIPGIGKFKIVRRTKKYAFITLNGRKEQISIKLIEEILQGPQEKPTKQFKPTQPNLQQARNDTSHHSLEFIARLLFSLDDPDELKNAVPDDHLRQETFNAIQRLKITGDRGWNNFEIILSKKLQKAESEWVLNQFARFSNPQGHSQLKRLLFSSAESRAIDSDNSPRTPIEVLAWIYGSDGNELSKVFSTSVVSRIIETRNVQAKADTLEEFSVQFVSRDPNVLFILDRFFRRQIQKKFGITIARRPSPSIPEKPSPYVLDLLSTLIHSVTSQNRITFHKYKTLRMSLYGETKEKAASDYSFLINEGYLRKIASYYSCMTAFTRNIIRLYHEDIPALPTPPSNRKSRAKALERDA